MVYVLADVLVCVFVYVFVCAVLFVLADVLADVLVCVFVYVFVCAVLFVLADVLVCVFVLVYVWGSSTGSWIGSCLTFFLRSFLD